MAKEDLIQRYEKAYERYQKRLISWVEKFHAVVKEIPHVKYAKNITEESIKRLEREIWPKFSERKKKSARKEYERQYEEGKEGIYFPKPPYTPPTEKGWLKVPYKDILPGTATPPVSGPDEDGYREPVVSRDEIIAWVDANINDITVERELDGVREQLNNLVLEAADAYGDYETYLGYLEQNAGTLNELVTKALSGYVGKSGKIYQEDPQALSKFATVLNLNRPLDQSQSERLENEGWVSYDFND